MNRNHFKTGKKVVVVTLPIVLEFHRKFGNNWSSSLDDYLKKRPIKHEKALDEKDENTTSSVDPHNFKTFGNILKYITLRDKNNLVV